MRCAFFCWLFFVSTAYAADDTGLRETFRTAYDAAQAGETRSANEDALRGHMLYPYIEAARLRFRLSRTPEQADAGIAEFLRAQADEPAGVRLRKAWLLSLAERKKWQDFLAAAVADTTDATLRCHALAARAALQQTDNLRADIIRAWQTGKSQPDACDDAFDWLRAQGALTDELIRQRTDLALQAGEPRLARKLAERLPASPASKALIESARLLENPQAEFSRQLRSGLPDDARITLAAFSKLARRDSTEALMLLEPLAAKLPAGQRAALTHAAALGLAYDHRAEALELFRKAGASADPLVLEWRLRSALWASDWPQVLAWIAELPGGAQQEPRWRYWRGRALAASGKDLDARVAYAEAAQERGYYGFLAAERNGANARVEPKALDANPAARASLEKIAALQRARELFLADLENEASAEFRYAVAPLDAASQKEAARLASEWGWHQQAISLLATLDVWDDVALRYPLPYAKEISAAAKESAVEIEQIYAVMRQESLYNPRARSSADAYGLMQMLLPTARRTAAKFGVARPATRDLLEPARNLRLGALHLKELLADFKNHWPLVLTAYNAGPGRARDWLPLQTMPADIWIENIPFNETRLYVQRIFGHRVLFGWRRSGKPQTMLPLMNDIPSTLEE